MKRVGIADLKAHLSRYLAEVQAGETIVVCDRKRPVAKITGEHAPPPLGVRPAERPFNGFADVQGVELLVPIDDILLLRELRRDK